MASSQVRNMRQIIVGGEVASANLGAGSGLRGTSISGLSTSLAEGEIGVFDEKGVIVREADSPSKIRIALGRAANEGPLLSDLIDVASIKSMQRSAYSAKSHQVSTIGYDGATAGTALNVIADNLYFARVYIQELIRSNSDGRRIKQGVFKSTSTSTQADIALGLAKNFVENFVKEPEKFIKVKAMCNVALASGEDFDGTMSVVKDTKLISVTSSGTYNTGTALAVGDFIRMGASATTAVALTDDVYKVVAISGTTTKTVELDRPVQLPTGSYATGSDYNQVITAAAGVAADWGIALTGQDLSFDAGKFNFAMPMWELGLENFGTSSSATTAASKGNGAPEEIMQLEWFLKGDQSGEIYRIGEPNIFTGVYEANLSVAGGGYDVINIEFEQSENVTFGPEVSPKQLLIAVPATAPGYAVTGVTDDITDVLEAVAVLAGLGTVDLSMA